MRDLRKLTVLVSMLSAIALGAVAGSAQADTLEKIRVIGTLPLKSFATTALENFKKDVETDTGNKLKVDVFPAGQLYNDVDAVKVLPTGAVDVGVVNLDFWTGLVPSAGILYMPTYYKNLKHFYAIRDAVSPTIDKDLQQKGNVKLLGWYDYDSEALISKKKLTKLEDFQGTKLRGYGQYAATFLQAVGSSPVVMSSTQAYDAMAKGVIGGSMSGPTSHLARKFYEVGKYLIDQPNFIQPMFSYAIVVNLDSWKKLTPDMQKAIEKASQHMQSSSKDVVLKNSEAAIAKLKEKGVTIISKLDPEQFDRIKEKVWPALEEKYTSQVGAEKAKSILDQVNDLRSKY